MKVLFLGIDALDRLLLEEFAPDLPNLTRLKAEGVSLPVRSTFPPDSDTAWATIATGLNPAQHGVVRFVDPLEKSYQILNVGTDSQALQGKTFWEIAGQAGYQAHAIFPHVCYPIWPTPGSMVVRAPNVAEVQANPPQLLDEYPNRDVMLGVRGLPERGIPKMLAYARSLADLAQADAEFAMRLMKKLDWNLYFVYWSTLDAIAHFYWNYFDPQDPGFEDGHPLQQVILDTYKLYDQIVGRYMDAVGEDTTIMVLSDHGHGTRPFNLVNINEILRQAGFLVGRDPKTNPHVGIFESSKRLAIHMVSRLGLGKLAGKVMRLAPGVVQTFTRPASINWEKTIAYASDMSGIKSYSYGGIIINRQALSAAAGNLAYEDVRTKIIELLQEKCVLPDGEPLVKFIARREDLYAGPHIDNYPDILLEFKYGYGLGWAVHAPLITHAAAHNIVPGSHRGETGAFLMRSPRTPAADTIDLHDILPTVLDLLGVETPDIYDGRSVFAEQEPETPA